MSYTRYNIQKALERDVEDEPGYTCPIIDSAISALNCHVDDMTERLETIRSANAEIRGWGEAWKNKAVDIQMELEEMRKEKEDLEDQVKNLQEELQSLQKVAA